MSNPSNANAGDCCSSCDDEVVSQVPGPAGATGAAGTDGTDGINPRTTLADAFQIPAADATSDAKVVDSTWAVVGQIVVMEGGGSGVNNATAAGYYVVGAIPDATHITLLNPASLASLNGTPGNFVGDPQAIGPAGGRGPTGASGAGATLDSLSPTTTKGDLIVDDGANSPDASDVRLARGTNGHILHTRSTQPTGLEWTVLDLTGVLTLLSGALPIANGGTGAATRQAAINALLAGVAAGDVFYYNGTNIIRLAIGTANQLLRTNAGATAPEWATVSAGTVLQEAAASSATYSTVTTQIPWDDTIPQIGEGTQILSLAFTPLSAASRMVVYVWVPIVSDSASDTATIGLFVGSANAISASSQAIGLVPQQISLTASYAPGSAAALTFTVRIGTNSPSNLYINGNSAARKLGGAQSAKIVVVEYS